MRTKNIFIALVLMVAAVLLSVPMASAQYLIPKVHPKSGLYGYWGIKKNGNEAFIIKPKFNRAERFVNGHAFVSVNGAWYVIGNDGKALLSTTYSEASALSNDHYRVRQGDKYGVVDLRSLAEILPIKYDAINILDGKYRLTINGKYGLADKAGKEILPIKYDAINILDGKYELTIDGKHGLADKYGKEILPIKYDAINIFDGKYRLTIDGKHGLADKAGKEILPIKYDAISTLGNAYKVAIGDKCGIVDGENKEIIPIKYDAISTLGNGYEVAIGDEWGIVDKTNKVIVEPQYKAIESVAGGLYALFSDKWLFVDSSGRVVDISDRVMHYATNNGQKIAKHPAGQNLFCDGVGALVFTNVIEPEQWINFLMGFDNVNRINGKEIISDGVFKILGDKLVWVDGDASSVSIPASVKSIASTAFSGCENLIHVNVADINVWLSSGIKLGKINLYHNGELVSNFVIPSGVTRIEDNQFAGCSYMASISLPNTVTSIGKCAFEGCISLTSVTIPNSVKSIGKGAFRGCRSLTSVTIPNSVTVIEDEAFRDCRNLTSITIPNSVTSIGRGAFEWCSRLTSVTIPNSVINICTKAFYCCLLTEVTIPASVKTLGKYVFGGYAGNLTVYMQGVNPPALVEQQFFDEKDWRMTYKLYVPKNALFNYNTADFWKDLAGYIYTKN